MAETRAEECQSIDGDRPFRWAVVAVSVQWMTFVSFALLKSILLVSAMIAGSAVARVLACVALVVAFIAEELSADRVVAAASDDELVLFQASGCPRARPTAVLRRTTPEMVNLESTGLLSDRWRLDDRAVRIGRSHRSTIERWVNERSTLPLTCA